MRSLGKGLVFDEDGFNGETEFVLMQSTATHAQQHTGSDQQFLGDEAEPGHSGWVELIDRRGLIKYSVSCAKKKKIIQVANT
tara:strand:- start:34 stop:279 length:246 start_codon:yes stop_codon:yes gene_type:complete